MRVSNVKRDSVKNFFHSYSSLLGSLLIGSSFGGWLWPMPIASSHRSASLYLSSSRYVLSGNCFASSCIVFFFFSFIFPFSKDPVQDKNKRK